MNIFSITSADQLFIELFFVLGHLVIDDIFVNVVPTPLNFLNCCGVDGNILLNELPFLKHVKHFRTAYSHLIELLYRLSYATLF